MIQMDAITVVFYAAIVGAVSALLGSIVAGLFSYLTTRASNKAKLREMTFENALRKVYSVFGDTKTKFEDFNKAVSHGINSNGDGDYYVTEYQGPYEEGSYTYDASDVVRSMKHIDDFFINRYNQYRLYVPKYIDDKILLYHKSLLQKVSHMSLQQHEAQITSIIEEHDKQSEHVRIMIQKYMGYS